jgi:catechol 2,3-dioxygenase-like lactoylglutathione lyase family enzyme
MDDENHWAALVPELLVTDLARSLAFYRDACGFRVRFARPEDGFAYLERGKAQIMLEEIAADAWVTGPLDPPFGRGINLQIEVEDIAALHARLLASGARLFRPLTTEWYREGEIEHGQTQFLVQDPDGYLLRFMQPLGERPASR